MVRTLGPGEMFGHEALLLHFRNVQKTGNGNHKVPVRQFRVAALERSDIFFIDLGSFYNFFNDMELKSMMGHIVPIDREDIREKVKKNFDSIKNN